MLCTLIFYFGVIIMWSNNVSEMLLDVCCIGFYIGRRMHRPGLSELEALMKYAESLPVDGVDGQAHLRFASKLLCNM